MSSLLAPLLRPLGRDLRASVLEAAARAGLGTVEPDPEPVTEHDLDGLPEPAQRYLRFMGVLGRPRDRSFVAQLRGRFRRAGQPWMPCEAWQYNTDAPVARIFHMRIDFGWVLPMVGHDTYLDGRGAMRGKLLGLVTVADGAGPEFDIGELTTFLNDALVLAPSMLLDESTRWLAVDEPDLAEHAFDIAFTDRGRTVRARVFVDGNGAMVDFATDDRWADLPDGLVRARWTTPFDGWVSVNGRRYPTGAKAVWHLDTGELPYVDGTFVPASVADDVALPPLDART